LEKEEQSAGHLEVCKVLKSDLLCSSASHCCCAVVEIHRTSSDSLKLRLFSSLQGDEQLHHAFAGAMGGAARRGVATPGDILPNFSSVAYQSIIHGGNTFLTIRAGIMEGKCFGDRIDPLIPLNQDSIDRHLHLSIVDPPSSIPATRFSRVPRMTTSSSVHIPSTNSRRATAAK
jgi:hypothetical protein